MAKISFKHPPVIETVLGAQFHPVAGLSSAHLGWYWRSVLNADEWTSIADAPVVEDQFERFGPPVPGWFSNLKVTLSEGPTPDRVQILNERKDRLIQVQPTRFLYNWQKQSDDYPRYEKVKPEFHGAFEGFREFLNQARLKIGELNQWEVTYVNVVPPGPLWHEPSEWSTVFPGLLGGSAPGLVRLESVGGEWHFEIPPRRGRLHVSVQHGTTKVTGTEQVLIVQMTARGPIGTDGAASLDAGLDLGHDTIVQSFVDLSSPAAHIAWGKE
jgi:uncharacterized protein (TIGR04255 family)